MNYRNKILSEILFRKYFYFFFTFCLFKLQIFSGKISAVICMKKILIVDDDINIGNMLDETLSADGYKILRAYSGTEVLMLLENTIPDLVLLDLMLPGLSGEEVLPKIKDIPVIVISAKVDVNDKITLLLGGAADYVTKPFNINELKARISVQLRNTGERNCEKELLYDGIRLDTQSHIVTVCNREVKLTRTEYAILKLLMKNPKQVIAKSTLLDRISDDTPDCTESSLKIHISNLRKKLRQESGEDYIEAVWGIGFKMHSVE